MPDAPEVMYRLDILDWEKEHAAAIDGFAPDRAQIGVEIAQNGCEITVCSPVIPQSQEGVELLVTLFRDIASALEGTLSSVGSAVASETTPEAPVRRGFSPKLARRPAETETK